MNVYADDNAYFTNYPWERAPRPSARTVPGDTLWTMEQENHFELALGTRGRSQLGQWDIWQAVFGPQGADGYPAPIWDKQTGEIDHGGRAGVALDGPVAVRRRSTGPQIGRRSSPANCTCSSATTTRSS